MIPVTAPPPTFNMYGLNMKSLKFRKVPIQPKLYSMENAFVSYPLAIDCDDSGGVITAELGSSLKYCISPYSGQATLIHWGKGDDTETWKIIFGKKQLQKRNSENVREYFRINYFPSQNTPLSLCKLAEHSVYR
ncbi:hypothetical protein Y032_0007g3383 [Ancylostoma ceylanicum]|nr:hypothetical protein Y032_0007g3383 [Ancylostoma ceylanicum]